MKTRLLFAVLALLSTVAHGQSPYPNQQQTSQVVPMALIAPSGTPPSGNAWTPRALLVDSANGGLKVSVAAAVTATSAGNGSVQTSATGSTYVALSSQSASRVHIVNTSGTTIEVQQGGTGVALPVATGTGFTFNGITNASQLALRRTDVSNTQVTVYYRWEN